MASRNARRRKRLGQFYTPPEVVRFIYDTVGCSADWSVIDPCCGEGAFLVEGLRRGARVLVGLERDPRVLRRLRRRLAAERSTQTDVPARARLAVIGRDGLAAISPDNDAPNGYDLAVGNPPFNSGRYRDPQADDACRRYLTALPSLALADRPCSKKTRPSWSKRGDWEIEAAFLLRFVFLVRPGGRVAVILPKGFFTNRKLRELRQAIVDDCTVDAIVELPASTFAASGARVRTAVLLLRRQLARRGHRALLAHAASLGDLPGVAATLIRTLHRTSRCSRTASRKRPYG